MTEHVAFGGRIYLCSIKACIPGRIVCYAIESRSTSELAMVGLGVAVMLRGRPTGTILDCDRGGQCKSKKSDIPLRNRGII